MENQEQTQEGVVSESTTENVSQETVQQEAVGENLSEGQEPSTPVESDLAEAPADQQVEPQSEPSEA